MVSCLCSVCWNLGRGERFGELIRLRKDNGGVVAMGISQGENTKEIAARLLSGI